MKRFCIFFDPELMARLQAVADAANHTVASVIRYCIEQQLLKLEETWKIKSKS